MSSFMGTSGTLELLIGEERIVKGRTLDGYDAYAVLNELLELYDSGKTPSVEEIKKTFEAASRKWKFTSPDQPRPTRMTDSNQPLIEQYDLDRIDHPVIIDMNKRIIFVEQDHMRTFYDYVAPNEQSAKKFTLCAGGNLEACGFRVIFLEIPAALEDHGYTPPASLPLAKPNA